jgi:hypothetical protein
MLHERASGLQADEEARKLAGRSVQSSAARLHRFYNHHQDEGCAGSAGDARGGAKDPVSNLRMPAIGLVSIERMWPGHRGIINTPGPAESMYLKPKSPVGDVARVKGEVARQLSDMYLYFESVFEIVLLFVFQISDGDVSG